MGFVSKSDALASIKMRVQSNHGANYTIFEAYVGTDPFTSKPTRKYARTEAKLKEKLKEFYDALSTGGEAGATLTRYQIMDAKEAIDLLKQHGSQMRLVDCVTAALGVSAAAPVSPSISVCEAFDRYTEATKAKSESYRKDIRLHIGKWVLHIGKDTPLSNVTAVAVKKYLMDTIYKHDNVGSWVTYNNNLGTIKTFISWCSSIEQKLLPADPLDGMKKLVIPYRQPDYMKAEDVRKLFIYLWEHRNIKMWETDLAYAILSFLCGMRQSEIDRVRLGEAAIKINLVEKFIRVGIPKGVSKGIRPRTFAIPEQALAWMLAFDFMGAVVRKNRYFRRHLTWAADDANIKMPKNAGRHTFITMFEAVHHNESALTAIVGNTDDVRAKSYNGVELRSEGEAYFKILPPTA